MSEPSEGQSIHPTLPYHDFQFAHDVRDPIYAQWVVDSDGGALLEHPRFEHVNDIGHPDILSEIECARRMLVLIQLSITDPVTYWWSDFVVSHNTRVRIYPTPATWRRHYNGTVLELVVHSPYISYHDMGVGREIAYPSYSSGTDARPRWGYETHTFIRLGILPSDRNVVSLFSNVNEPDAEHPRLLIGVVQYQRQTALVGGQTQIYRMLGPLLELMTEAERHEEDDDGHTIVPVNYDTLHNALAEIAVLLFASNGSDIGSNPNVYRRNVLAPTAPFRLMTDDNSTLPMKADDAAAGANPAPG